MFVHFCFYLEFPSFSLLILHLIMSGDTPEPLSTEQPENSNDLEKKMKSDLLAKCHEPKDSLFSSTSNYTNYRGLLNLCIILLVISFFSCLLCFFFTILITFSLLIVIFLFFSFRFFQILELLLKIYLNMEYSLIPSNG